MSALFKSNEIKLGSKYLAGLTAALVTAGSTTIAQAAPPHYHVDRKFAVGGDGGWDYLSIDSDTGRLYVSRGTHIQVVDVHDGKVVGDIPNTPGVHRIALVTDIDRGFTSNGGDSTVSEIDLSTLKELKRIKVDEGPDCIIYDPGSKRVFTFNGRANDSTAIDVNTGTVAGTIPLDGRPEFAAADGRGHVYVNIEDKSEIAEIDSRALKVTHVWSIAPGDSPSGLAVDTKYHRLFSVCRNGKMIVLNADTGQVVATPAIGEGPDAASFDPDWGLAFSSNGRSGTLTVVREEAPNAFEVMADVPTEPSARTMALDTKTHKIYLATAKMMPPPPGTTGHRRGKIVPGTFAILEVAP